MGARICFPLVWFVTTKVKIRAESVKRVANVRRLVRTRRRVDVLYSFLSITMVWQTNRVIFLPFPSYI